VRGLALANAGLVSEAIGELRAPLGAWREDPARLYMLARLSHEHGLTYVALNAAERLATLAGEREAGVAPAAVRRLIFPTPYRTIVAEQAREHDVDPLALYALLRQESHFNPAATSWVGARGLAQVMPATAQGIAQELGIEGFNIDQLYHPEVSVRFGAYYLSQQIDNMGGSLPGALAAYNGGLGNAWRWAGGETVTDPDLFAERIDFAETRGYVKLVYGFYSAYRGIYQPGG
jgi:soluble lytic murein transglycosylase